MAKSLLIEIDEATKDIMTELQDSLTKNIETGISNSLQSVIQQQQRSISQIEDILELQLSTVLEDLGATKKPITRIARDVEEIIHLVMKLEKLQIDQADQLTNLRQQQIESIQQHINQMIGDLSKTQAEVLAKGIQSFEVTTEEAVLILSTKLQEVQQQFSNVTDMTQTKLNQQYEQFVDLNDQLAANHPLLQQEIQTFKKTIALQEKQFEKMKVDLIEQANALIEAYQQSFSKHTTALTQQHEDQMKQLTVKLKEQVGAIVGVVQQLVTSNNLANSQLNDELNGSMKSMEKRIVEAIENNRGFDLIKEKLTAMEASLSSLIKEQALIDKIANVERDLSYARLPFYKKWFTKREDF